MLKEHDQERFAQALRHYDEIVLPALAGGQDVFEAWVQYGQTLANLSAPGRMMTVDETGRAVAFAAPVRAATLILHVPDDNTMPIFVAAMPARAASEAYRSTKLPAVATVVSVKAPSQTTMRTRSRRRM